MKYDIKVYDNILVYGKQMGLEERETIRRLSYDQKTAIEAVLKIHKVRYLIYAYC